MGTTTEAAIRRLAVNPGARLTLVPVERAMTSPSARSARARSTAYVADRDLLVEMLAARGNPADILIADEFLTVELYALAMRRGEDRLRLIAEPHHQPGSIAAARFSRCSAAGCPRPSPAPRCACSTACRRSATRGPDLSAAPRLLARPARRRSR